MSKVEKVELNGVKPSGEEATRLTPTVVVINESDPGNILSDPSRGFDFLKNTLYHRESLEGFANNYSLQKDLASYFIDRFNIVSRGPLLDIGFGTNTGFPGQFRQAGILTSGVDVRRNPGWMKNDGMGNMSFDRNQYYKAPQEVDSVTTGFRTYDGDIILMDADDSHLKNQKFGLITFMGSWSSPGNNFSIEERQREVVKINLNKDLKPWPLHIEKIPHHMRDQIVRARRLIQQEIEKKMKQSGIAHDGERKVLEICVGHLLDRGMIGIVSSRYAYRGAGYFFEDLPDEKQEFSWLYQQFLDLGTTTIYLIGMSRDGFNKAFQMKPNSISTNEYDKEVSTLLDQSKREEVKDRLFEPTGIDSLDELVRIDAIFAEFKEA